MKQTGRRERTSLRRDHTLQTRTGAESWIASRRQRLPRTPHASTTRCAGSGHRQNGSTQRLILPHDPNAVPAIDCANPCLPGIVCLRLVSATALTTQSRAAVPSATTQLQRRSR
jgi:hypothetical protein